MRLRGRLTLLLLAAALCGCVAFRGNKLPDVPVESLAKSKVEDVSYKLRLRFDGVESSESLVFYDVILDEKLSHVFANTHRADAPLHLDVVLVSSRMSPWNQVWLAVSELTAFVVPVRRKIVYTLRAQADWQGRPFKTYQYGDSLNLWIWVLFVPLMPTHHYSANTRLDIIRNLETNFLADLSRDLETLAVAPTQ